MGARGRGQRARNREEGAREGGSERGSELERQERWQEHFTEIILAQMADALVAATAKPVGISSNNTEQEEQPPRKRSFWRSLRDQARKGR